jgi:hypothetical protein
MRLTGRVKRLEKKLSRETSSKQQDDAYEKGQRYRDALDSIPTEVKRKVVEAYRRAQARAGGTAARIPFHALDLPEELKRRVMETFRAGRWSVTEAELAEAAEWLRSLPPAGTFPVGPPYWREISVRELLAEADKGPQAPDAVNLVEAVKALRERGAVPKLPVGPREPPPGEGGGEPGGKSPAPASGDLGESRPPATAESAPTAEEVPRPKRIIHISFPRSRAASSVPERLWRRLLVR